MGDREKLFFRALFITGVICILLGVFITLNDQYRFAALEEQITALELQQEDLNELLVSVQIELDAHRREYASVHTASQYNRLSEMQTWLTDSGQYSTTVHAARAAQQDSRNGDPFVFADLAQNWANDIIGFHQLILGESSPEQPSFYEALGSETAQAQSSLRSAHQELLTLQTYLGEKRQDVWNREHGVVFNIAAVEIQMIQQDLDSVDRYSTTKLVDDYVEYDWVGVYRQAQAVRTSITNARGLIDQEHQLSRNAFQELAEAEVKILNADDYILKSNYRQAQALEALRNVRLTYNQAQAFFWGQQSVPNGQIAHPDYQQAYNLAVQAQYEADDAWLIAATPTPTPLPTATPVPPPPDDDDDDSFFGGSSCCSSSYGDSGGTSFGSDYGSGGSSWSDSSGGFSGSDGFGGGDDGFSSSDGF